MPETLRRTLSGLRRRRRVRLIADGVAIGGATFAAGLVLTGQMSIGLAAGALAAAIVIARGWRISTTSLAQLIESAHGSLDNLIVTAAELEERPRPVRAEILGAISAQAAARVQAVDVAGIAPLTQSIGVAVTVLTGATLLASVGARTTIEPSRTGHSVAERAALGSISVRVTPPAYTRRPAETHHDPLQITVIDGTGIRVETAAGVLREWTATRPESVELHLGHGVPPRFLSVMVVPDRPPAVRIDQPGRDSAFADGKATLQVGIDSRDDLGLASLSLRYTTASGGGENVTFTEGEVPLSVTRATEREWKATATWDLGALQLTDGDVVVYRAVARDLNPTGAAVESDAFLVEIGRASEVAGAGFALPTEDRKYAISQQMVIYKTEQLLARLRRDGGGAASASALEESRLIGMEQRMVRAEVIFLSGGEVEDEVEEAAHSHELAEGRLQNQGRAEMLRAINFMSRAEAQLNDGRVEEALVLERQALASLERALDRRRYFLRTLPDRSRIDVTRRLTGDRRQARSWFRQRAASGPPAASRAREVILLLTAALNDGEPIDGALAARVAAVDPSSPDLQQAGVAVAASRDDRERQKAVVAAIQALTSYALKHMPGSMVVPLP